MANAVKVLNEQIAGLNAEKTSALRVGENRATRYATEQDPKLLDESVAAFAKAEAVQRRIEVLQTTLAAAERIDKAERAAEWQREHRERIERVHTLADQRIKKAKVIDAALGALNVALQDWQAASDELTTLVRSFAPARHLPESVRIARVRALRENAEGSSPAMGFALSQGLQRVIAGAGLTEAVRPYMEWAHVHVDLRRQGITAEAAAGNAAEQLRLRLVEKGTTDE